MSEEHFEPFQKVLVCNGAGDHWRKALYDRVLCSTKYKYMTIGGARYRYCIDWGRNKVLSDTLVEEDPETL